MLLMRSSLENFRTYDVSGSIDATIMLNNSFSNNDNFNYGLYGKINNFNLVNNNDYNITLENFNGDIELKDNLLVAKGKAFINKSESNIDKRIKSKLSIICQC